MGRYQHFSRVSGMANIERDTKAPLSPCAEAALAECQVPHFSSSPSLSACSGPCAVNPVILFSPLGGMLLPEAQ